MEILKIAFLTCLILFNFYNCSFSQERDSLYTLGMESYCDGIAYSSSDRVKAISLFKKAIILFEKTSDWEEYIDCYNRVMSSYYREKEYDSASKYAHLAVQESQNVFDKPNKKQISALNNLAAIYYQKEDLKNAGKILQKIIDIKLTIDPKGLTYDRYYNNLGIIYKDLGDYNEALRFLQKTIEIRKSKKGQKMEKLASIYLLVGKIYSNQKRYQLALKYNFIANSLFSSVDNSKGFIDLELVDVNHNAAIIYLGLNKPDSSYYFINKAEVISNKKRIKPLQYQYLHKTKAQIYLQFENKNLAIKEGKKHLREISLLHEKFSNPNSLGIASVELAKIYIHFDEFKQASDLLIDAFGYHNDQKVNNIKDIALEKVSRPFETAKLLKVYSQLYYNSYKKYQKHSDLEQFFSISLLSTQLIPQIYREFKNEDSRLFMAEQSVSTYELAIKAALELYYTTKEDSFLNHSLTFAEQNKAALLYQSLKDSEYKQTIGIPESILEKESSNKIDLTFYRGKVFKEEQKGEKKNQELLDQWKEKIFDLEEQKRRIRNKIETSYPQYYQLKYQSTAISPEDIRSQLAPDQAMIEYFRGDSATYAFVITKKDFWVKELPNHDSIQHWVNRMREGLYHYWMGAERTKESRTLYNHRYVEFAYQLHQTLIEPLKKDRAELPKKLIFIPDGVLGYLPFDALLSEVPSKPEQFGTHVYLMNSHQISYAYSGALWKDNFEEKRNSSQANESMLAIGPTFGDQEQLFASVDELRRDGFSPLLHNKKEVENINQLFGGELLIDQHATKASFLEQAPDFQFIHLSTHAKANDSDSRFSRIAFTPINDTTEDNDFLTLAEISNLHLNANMVVLSACETALGELQRGEGIMSLARAFTYAGAQSIITTLWSVNDGATADLMTRFYGHLAEGLTKDAALRQARLDFIANSDHEFAHPFFWAAAVPMGDMTAIDQGLSYWVWIGGVLIISLLIGIWVARKKRKTNS